ncbi:MAG TPA: DUF4149 domain-containing protein, partial [Pyrinomonadaceae bacterium]
MEAKLSEHGGAVAVNTSAARAGEAPTARANVASGGSTLGDARLLLVGMWLGAAVLFSFGVAPSAFAVLPAREWAGAIVTRIIGIVNVSGFALALLLLATAFARRGGAAT